LTFTGSAKRIGASPPFLAGSFLIADARYKQRIKDMVKRKNSAARMLNALATFTLVFLSSLALAEDSGVVLFEEKFSNKLGEGWVWVREHRQAWRLNDGGLEIKVEPGNMWGPANDAKNVLVRPVPKNKDHLEFTVTVRHNPTAQYEQVDLVWYYDDSHMVKLGQEMVDGKLSIVMGREEKDRTRTIAIIPLDSQQVELKLEKSGREIRGAFRTSTNQPSGLSRSCGCRTLGASDRFPHTRAQALVSDYWLACKAAGGAFAEAS
jgi:regulation of enolase protein 1 (concanavalin A-like superfamily)